MQQHSYEHTLSFALEHPWALTRPMLAVVADLLARRIAHEPVDHDAIAAALVAKANRGGVAGTRRAETAATVIPVYGVIAPRMNLLSDMSGGTTFETLTSQLRAAVADPRVTQIVFDVDSPGGNAAGATEFAKEVLAARAKKRIVAVASHTMASAAYWAMAGASEIVATPSSMVGSIGVFSIHDDITESLAKLGIKRTVLSAGKFKGEGVDGGPLSVEAAAHVQSLIDSAYGRFVAAVAAGRNVPPSRVRAGFGEGRVLDAEAARAAHLVDRIATLDDVLGHVDTTAANVALAHREQELAAVSQAMRERELEALVSRRRLQ